MRKKLYLYYVDYRYGSTYGTVEVDLDPKTTELHIGDSISTAALKQILREMKLAELARIKEVRMIEMKNMGNFTDQAKTLIEKRQL